MPYDRRNAALPPIRNTWQTPFVAESRSRSAPLEKTAGVYFAFFACVGRTQLGDSLR
jgi:hypothetical protein